MKKTITIVSVIVLLLIVAAGGYFFYQKTQVKNLGSIVYGWNTWPGNLPYFVAYEQGFFKAEGMDVKMVAEESYAKKIDDLTAGKIDFPGTLALIDVVEKVSKGEKWKVVLAVDYSNGADGIVAKKDLPDGKAGIKSIYELKGKKVAVEKGTLGEYLLRDALKKNNLNLSDVQELNLSAQEAAQAFIRGEVDAAVTYEPSYTQAVLKGNGWRIYTSADSPRLIIDVLTFRKDFIDANPEKVLAVVKAYFKAVDFISANPEMAYEIGAKYFKIKPSEFKEQYVGLKQMGLEDNLNILPFGPGANSLHGLIKEAYGFLYETQSAKNKINSTEIIDPSFARDAGE